MQQKLSLYIENYFIVIEYGMCILVPCTVVTWYNNQECATYYNDYTHGIPTF